MVERQPVKLDFDVIIVGAGPTGLTLANILGQAGVRTLLIEARAETVQEPRAVSIDDESLRTIQGLELLDEVEGGLLQGYGSEYRGPDGRIFLTVAPQSKPYGHPRRNGFRQPLFEAQLREGLRRFDTVQVNFNTRFLSFQ